MGLMLEINERTPVSLEDVGQVASMVRDMTDDAKALLDRWWEDRLTKDPDNVSVIG